MNKVNIFILVICLFLTDYGFANTITAISSGRWDAKTSWSGGVIPQCGDTVVIGSGKNVEVCSTVDFSTCGNAMELRIAGTLSLKPGKKMNLPCGSKVAMKEGGMISASGNEQIFNSIDICSETAWNNKNGTTSSPEIIEHAPQPAALVYFTAKPGNDGIVLSWMTSSENNNASFTVEKSKDGNTFTELGTVNGAGSSSSLSNYKFIDKTPFSGLQYYRLLQKDQNGTSNNMKPITIRWNHNPDFNIYPNPSKGELFANVANSLRKKIGLLMITCKGSVVISKDIVFSDKTKALSLLKPSEKLKPGEYEVNVICQGSLYTQLVTVE